MIINIRLSLRVRLLFKRNYLGINKVYLGLPAIINKLGVSRVLKIALNLKEEDYFKKSAQKLRNVIEHIGLD